MSRERETPSPAHPDHRRIRTLAVATLCNSAAVLPAGLTVILAVQIRNDLGITPLQFGLGGAVAALPAAPVNVRAAAVRLVAPHSRLSGAARG